MELKTKIHAEEGTQDLTITREFELPVELLFKAHTEPEIVEQWMGTKVMKLDAQKHGVWHFITSDNKGNPVFQANGVFHEFVPNQKIIRTFEMENAPMGVQLEFFEFKPLTEDTSKLIMHIVYQSAEARNMQLKMPFAKGLNMAHDRLQEVVTKLKQA